MKATASRLVAFSSGSMSGHLAAALALLLVAEPAMTSTPSPYAGIADRPIRALSDAQREELLAGRGLGLALGAELNGWGGTGACPRARPSSPP